MNINLRNYFTNMAVMRFSKNLVSYHWCKAAIAASTGNVGIILEQRCKKTFSWWCSDQLF
jgi:hypothetical protein